jgi:tRNA 2-thiouridine synthesizing protein A
VTDFDHTLDLIGLKCPLPALKTAKLLKTMRAGATLRVHCSDPMAVIDIPNLLNETGDLLIAQRQEGTVLVFEIEKRS